MLIIMIIIIIIIIIVIIIITIIFFVCFLRNTCKYSFTHCNLLYKYFCITTE